MAFKIQLPEVKSPDSDFNIRLIETTSQAKMACEVLSKEDIIAVDTETEGLHPHKHRVHLFQIGNPNHMFVVDAAKVNPQIFRSLLVDTSKLKILQNAVFDYKMLKHHFDLDIYNIYDTMLAELVLTSGLYGGGESRKKASLFNLCKKYLDIGLEKAIRMDFTKLPYGFDFKTRPDLIKYSGLDVYYPIYIYKQQRHRLIDKNLVQAAKLEFDLVEVVAGIELGGVGVDCKKWRKFIQEIEALYYRTQTELYTMFNKVAKQKTLWADAPSINLQSSIQVMRALRDMGYKIANTDHYSLLEFQKEDIVKKLLEFRKYSKLLAAYGYGLLEKADEKNNRIHAEFNQMGAAQTSRFSSASPNLQQIPADTVNTVEGETIRFRDIFIPRPGYKFIAGDYSQQEVRIAAQLFKDATLRSAYENELDVYRVTAALMFDKKYEEIDKKSFERQLAKTIVLASNYGGGPDVIRRNLLETGIVISFDDAKSYLDKYQQSYPELMENLNKYAEKAFHDGFVEYSFGKKRFFYPLIKQLESEKKGTPEYKALKAQIKRRAKNTPIQGNAAVMTKLALIGIHTKIKTEKWDAKIALVVHDEIVLEANNSIAEEVRSALDYEMDKAFQTICPGFPNKTKSVIMTKWEKD